MLSSRKEILRGYSFVFIAAFLYGSMPIMVKLAYESGLLPTNVLWMRYAFSFLILYVFLRLVRKESAIILDRLVFIQGIMFLAGGLLFFYALKSLAAGLAIVIMYTYPITVTLLAIPVYGEKPDRRLLASMALAVIGIALISGNEQSGNFTVAGALLALAASIAYALYTLIGQKTVQQERTFPLINTFFMIGAVLVAVMYYKDVAALASASVYQLALGAFMALFNTLLAVFFHLKGVEKVGASRAAFAGTAEPVFVIILAFMILGETLTYSQLAGSALVISSILFTIKPAASRQ